MVGGLIDGGIIVIEAACCWVLLRTGAHFFSDISEIPTEICAEK